MAAQGQELLAGIDIGGTSIKCCMYRADATPVAMASRPSLRAARTEAGGDPNELWAQVCEAAREVWHLLDGRERGAVRGIAVASVGCTAVLVDGEDRPLFPLFWSSPGMAALYEKVRETIGAQEYQRITRYPLEAEHTAFWLALLAEHTPDRFARIDAILAVADYINLRLTGLRAREYSTAASMALWDYRQGDWWRECLDALGLQRGVLGQPRWSGTYLGPLSSAAAAEMGWPQGMAVYLGGHDYPCAALAAGCVAPGSLLNVSGTFEILASFHDAPPSGHGSIAQRALVDHHVVEGMYTLMAEAVGAGHLEWLRRCLAPPKQHPSDWETLLGEMADLPSPVGRPPVLFVPHLFGRWVPDRQEAAWGCFAGLTGEAGRADLLRAIVEGICFKARQALDGLQGGARSDQPIRVVGGGSREPAWLRTKAAILGSTLSVPKLREATALGAALLAGIGAGVYADAADASGAAALQGADGYEPDPDLRAWYDEVYRTLYLPLLDATDQLDVRMRDLFAGRQRTGAP
jgi:xylulokinase